MNDWYKLMIYNLTKKQAEIIKDGMMKLKLKNAQWEIEKQIHGKRI